MCVFDDRDNHDGRGCVGIVVMMGCVFDDFVRDKVVRGYWANVAVKGCVFDDFVRDRGIPWLLDERFCIAKFFAVVKKRNDLFFTDEYDLTLGNSLQQMKVARCPHKFFFSYRDAETTHSQRSLISIFHTLTVLFTHFSLDDLMYLLEIRFRFSRNQIQA